jgi:hypothetical protein
MFDRLDQAVVGFPQPKKPPRVYPQCGDLSNLFGGTERNKAVREME